MVQQFVPGNLDLLSLASGYQAPSLQRPVNELHYYATPDPDVYSFEIIIRDLSYGLNGVWGNLGIGDAGPDSHRLQASTLNTSYPGQAVLPLLATDQGDAPSSDWISWAEIDGSIAFGHGSTADQALGRYLTSTGVGTQFGYVTYTPTNVIASMSAIVIGGVTNAQRFVVGKVGAAADVLTTAGIPGAVAASSAGSMHANTSSLWGIMTSGLNASSPGVPVHGLYAGGSFYTLLASAAIGDAPTSVATLPAGGYTVDPIFFDGWPARAFMVVPTESRTSGMFASSEPNPANLWHISLEFNDPQPMVGVPIRTVVHAIRHRNTLVVSDGQRNMMYDGKNWHDLGWVTEREPNTNVVYRNTGFAIIHDELCCWSRRHDSSGVSSSRLALERYDPSVKQWHQVTESITPTAFTAVSSGGRWAMGAKYTPYPTGKGHPVSNWLSEVMLPTLGNNYTIPVTPSGYSDFNGVRKTTGAAGATGASLPFAANGTSKSLGLLMPPLPGGGYGAHVVEQVECHGDVPASLSTGKVQVQLATQTSTGFSFSNNLKSEIKSADRLWREPTRFLDNEAFFDRLMYQVYGERDSTTTQVTFNALPITFRGLSYRVDALKRRGAGDARIKKPVSPRAFWASVGQRNGRRVA